MKQLGTLLSSQIKIRCQGHNVIEDCKGDTSRIWSQRDEGLDCVPDMAAALTHLSPCVSIFENSPRPVLGLRSTPWAGMCLFASFILDIPLMQPLIAPLKQIHKPTWLSHQQGTASASIVAACINLTRHIFFPIYISHLLFPFFSFSPHFFPGHIFFMLPSVIWELYIQFWFYAWLLLGFKIYLYV